MYSVEDTTAVYSTVVPSFMLRIQKAVHLGAAVDLRGRYGICFGGIRMGVTTRAAAGPCSSSII
jgi:hypothetical protein